MNEMYTVCLLTRTAHQSSVRCANDLKPLSPEREKNAGEKEAENEFVQCTQCGHSFN